MESEKTSGGDKYSKLAGNTIIFAISSFSSKLLTLIVQPFLTYAMAEISDLGLSKILSQYANLLIPFVSMGMSNAIIRFGLDKGNSEKQVFTNGLLTILGGFGILVLCWPVAQFLPDMAQYGLLIYIYVLMSCLRTLCTQFVRSRQWNKLVAVDMIWKLNSTAQLRSIQSLVSMPPKPFFMQSIYRPATAMTMLTQS